MSFRTNRRTQLPFPIRTQSRSGQRLRERFLMDKTSQKSNPEYAPPEKYNGWTNYDTWATYLILSNDERTYRWLGEWAKNWHRKVKGSRFDPEEAEYAVWRYIVPSAQGKAAPVRPEVGEDRINRANVNYGEIVDRIMEDHPNPGPESIGSGSSEYTRKDYGDLGVEGQ
jgi:hypothetical protein